MHGHPVVWPRVSLAPRVLVATWHFTFDRLIPAPVGWKNSHWQGPSQIRKIHHEFSAPPHFTHFTPLFCTFLAITWPKIPRYAHRILITCVTTCGRCFPGECCRRLAVLVHPPSSPQTSGGFRFQPAQLCEFSDISGLWSDAATVGIYYSIFGSTWSPNHSYIAVYFPLVLLQWHTEYSTGIVTSY